MKTLSLGQAKQFFTVIALVFFVILATYHTAAWSAESWQASFDDICSKVDASGSMTVNELVLLIEQADKLAPVIKASSDPSKKIYLQRLKRCRAMFQFMVDTKKSSES